MYNILIYRQFININLINISIDHVNMLSTNDGVFLIIKFLQLRVCHLWFRLVKKN